MLRLPFIPTALVPYVAGSDRVNIKQVIGRSMNGTDREDKALQLGPGTKIPCRSEHRMLTFMGEILGL